MPILFSRYPIKTTLLALAVILQLMILAGEYLNSRYPVWTGEKVLLTIVPVDPRSLFRGQYVRLEYDIGNLSSSMWNKNQSLRLGTVVYISLEKKNDVHIPSQASVSRPKSGLFIRGRLTQSYYANRSTRLHLNYGIEAYFLPEAKAIQLEKEMQISQNQGGAKSIPPKIGIAEVRIASNGKAALVNVQVVYPTI